MSQSQEVKLARHADDLDDNGHDNQTAAEIAFTPVGTVAATNVQAAIAEVSDDVSHVLTNPMIAPGDMIYGGGTPVNKALTSLGATASGNLTVAGPVSALIDGSDASYALKGNGASGGVITIDLGSASTIVSARTKCDGGSYGTTSAFNLSYSSNGTTWTILERHTNPGQVANDVWTLSAPTLARYWRLDAAVDTVGEWRVYTVELVGTAPSDTGSPLRFPGTTAYGRSLLTPADAAAARTLLGVTALSQASGIAFTPVGTVSATDVQAAIAEVAAEAGGGSSALAATGDMPYLGPITNYARSNLGATVSDNGYIAPYPSSNIIDGDDATMYHPNISSGAVATMNLGVGRSIDRWRIVMSTSSNEIPAAWILQYSLDGSTGWTTADTVTGTTGGDKGIRVFATGFVTARYWRIVQSGSVNWDARVNTVDLYGGTSVLATASTAYGRSILAVADAAAARTLLASPTAVRGSVSSAGAITVGTGFTVSKTGTGTYVVTFGTAFASTPVVVASCLVGGRFAAIANDVTPATASAFTVNTTIPGTGAADLGFSFIAMAP